MTAMTSGPGILAGILLTVGLAGCGNDRITEAEPTVVRQLDFEALRARMVERQIEFRGIRNPRVLEAMVRVPRHEFVPERYRSFSYDDNPLPIGFEQTISQPYIVALMTELVDPQPADRILEVGTGSGYQAAVAAAVVDHVYSIEIIPELAESAALRLRRLGIANVSVREGDGYLGWPEEGPFDGILVTAGAQDIPQPLVDQLVEGGRMIIPVGRTSNRQVLKVIEKLEGGRTEVRDVIPVRFVPLTRKPPGGAH